MKLVIPAARFFVGILEYGNTLSCTIPLALKQAAEAGLVKPGHLVMAVGFGVGHSWGATLTRWT
jgi:3-oxoacyl-[acyl-carrier-protein] synthase-3